MRLALEWGREKGEEGVPISGTTRRHYLEENVGAINVTLTRADLERIDEIAPKGAAAGDRYHADAMKLIGR